MAATRKLTQQRDSGCFLNRCDFLRLRGLDGELPQRQAFVMGEEQSDGNDSDNMMPQLTVSSLGTISKTWSSALMVASCEPPPTPGSWTMEPIMLDPIRRRTLVTLMALMGAP